MNNIKSDSTGHSSDPQIRLVKAFENRDIEEFRCALKVGGNPLAIDDQYFNIFGRALQTPGAAEFVSECFKAGCNPNHIKFFNDTTAIDLAIDSRDVNILKTLLSFPGVPVSEFLWTYFKNICNWSMFEHSSNITENFECMKFILEHEVFINESDYIEMFLEQFLTQFTSLEPYKLELVEKCLKVPNVNIDTDGLGILRRLLEKEFPSLELPHKSKSMNITYSALFNCIKINDMERFVEQYNDEMRCTTKDEDSDLLVHSIISGAHRAFDVLLEKGVDCNRKVPGFSPITYALSFGNLYALDKLLKQPHILIDTQPPLLCETSWGLIVEGNECDKCFDLLLNSVEIDINASDKRQNTALHHAVAQQNNSAVRKLLKQGASICITNNAHELAIERLCLWPLLEEHLDDCISSNGYKCGDKDYEICIDFKNFIRSTHNNEKQLSEALKPITFMKESREYRYLLQHPVITSLLYLKWHKLSLIFYINFILFLLIAASIVTFSVLRLRVSTNDYVMAREIAQYCSWLGICYFMVREILQLILSPLNYLFNISNHLEILLIGCSIVTCCVDIIPISMAWHRNIAVVCILLLAFELVSLAGSLPFKFISTNILILDAVCKSFAKFLGFYTIFILTFSLCFYIKSDTDAEKETTQEAYQKFSNPWAAILKTIVMFTGEFDADNIELDSNYMLFLTFVCFMTIILYNLLNGLAVSDTQAIKNQAELNEIICRINILERYEKTIFCTRQESFRFIRRLFKKLFPIYSTDRLMFIRPNDKNRIRTLKTNECASKRNTKVKAQNLENEKEAKITLLDELDGISEEDNSNRNRLLDWHYSFIKKISSRIDKQTVNQARQILAKHALPTIDSRLDSMKEKLNELRIVIPTVENRLDSMEEKLNELGTVAEKNSIFPITSRLDSMEGKLNVMEQNSIPTVNSRVIDINKKLDDICIVLEYNSICPVKTRLEGMDEKLSELRTVTEKNSTLTVENRLEDIEEKLHKMMTNLENIAHKLCL